MYRKSVARKGFTLIEILIVIAIIAMIAAILFPVLARARENARKSTCQSNLKQLALGMQMYVQDYNGVYPVYYSHYQPDPTVPLGTAWYGWANMIYPYVKSLRVYQCPSEKHLINPALKQANWRLVYDYTDYAYNSNFSYSFEPPYISRAIYTGIRESKLSLPAVTVLLQENWNGNQESSGFEPVVPTGYDFTYDSKGDYTSMVVSNNAIPMQRHLDGSNYAFADGHAKWLRYTSIARGYAGYWAASSNYCAPYPEPAHCNARPPSNLGKYIATFAPYDY